MLRYAWGIWRSEKSRVAHCASAGRAKRLRESVWHPLEKTEVQDNGDVC
ncbi:MAG: hypothetical protein R2856_29535 [Caldilineaceae bacterium]